VQGYQINYSPFSKNPCNNNNIGILHQPLLARTERGFDFLGYHFGPEGLSIAQKTLNNFVERATRLYEQGPGEPCGSARLGEYVQRWVRWAGAEINPPVPLPLNNQTI